MAASRGLASRRVMRTLSRSRRPFLRAFLARDLEALVALPGRGAHAGSAAITALP